MGYCMPYYQQDDWYWYLYVSTFAPDGVLDGPEVKFEAPEIHFGGNVLTCSAALPLRLLFWSAANMGLFFCGYLDPSILSSGKS